MVHQFGHAHLKVFEAIPGSKGTEVRRLRKASTYLIVSGKSAAGRGGWLKRDGGAYLRGGLILFRKDGGISSDLGYKVEKRKYKKLKVMEPRIKNKSALLLLSE